MIEHHLIGRWSAPADRSGNFAEGLAHFFDGAPEQNRAKLREDAQSRVKENYRLSGLGRHSPEQAIDLVVRSLSALSVGLAENPYLMGERPCGTDATMFGVIAGILTPFFDSPLRRRAQQFANLNAYVERMMAQYYPDHSWSPSALAA